MGEAVSTLGFLLSAVVASALVAAPPPAQEAPLAFSEESSVSWVLIPVTVRRASGSSGPARVRHLELKDFRLWVDDRPVDILSFEAGAHAPVRLIYLQDLSGSMANAGKLEASREALRCFLAQARRGDEFALVTFASGRTSFDVAFTPRTSRLEEAMDAWRGWGTTALHDAVARLPDFRAADRSVKQAAVLVTDGGDNASTLEPARAREILRAAELPVYVLDLQVSQMRDVPARPASFAYLLRLLASATGGRYHAVDGAGLRSSPLGPPRGTLQELCVAISEELRYQYVLGFRTRDAGNPTYHHLRVELAGDRFVLSHRRGYLGFPPP